MNVSVIIPLYNAEKYIAKAIESCLALDEVKEIIVIDDGYPDNGRNIVLNYVKVYDFIKLLDHSENGNLGAGASRNLGILKATQDYIAFLDADDYYLPNRFKKDKEVFKRFPHADGCYSSIDAYFYSESAKNKFFQSFTSSTTTVNPNANPTPENLFSGLLGQIPYFGYFHLNAFTIKKEKLIECNISFSKLKIHQDTDFLLQCAHKLKIYPSELSLPVAIRGVHDENRITLNNIQDQFVVNYNRFLMWENILNWAKESKMNQRFLDIIYDRYLFFKICSISNLNALNFFSFIIQNPLILKNSKYLYFHRKFFGKYFFSVFLFKIRNGIIKFL